MHTMCKPKQKVSILVLMDLSFLQYGCQISKEGEVDVSILVLMDLSFLLSEEEEEEI